LFVKKFILEFIPAGACENIFVKIFLDKLIVDSKLLTTS
jgi:hypothetical protein